MPYDDSDVGEEPTAAPESWEVCGDQDVLGHAPGETFEAVIPEAQAQRLQDRGALRRVGGGEGGHPHPVDPAGVNESASTEDDNDDNAENDDVSAEGEEY